MISELVLGLGIFFVGLQLIGSALRGLTGSGLSQALQGPRNEPHPFLGALVGTVFGALLQSATAVSFILASMVRSGVIGERTTPPIIFFCNVGLTGLAFLTTLNIHPAVAYLVGFSGILCGMIKRGRVRQIAGILLGMGLILYGLQAMGAGASTLNGSPWMHSALGAASANPMLGFGAGFLVAAILQSNTGAAMLVITFCGVGAMSVPEALPVLYGANLGAIPLRVFLSSQLHGPAFRVVRLEDIFCIWSGLLMLGLLYLERAGVPLIAASLPLLSADPKTQVALGFLLSNLLPAFTLFAAQKPVVAALARLWPGHATPPIGAPRFIMSAALDDPHTAMGLCGQEISHLLELVSVSASPGPAPQAKNPDESTPAEEFTKLSNAIEEFIASIAEKNTLTRAQALELHTLRSGLAMVRHIEEAARNLSWSLSQADTATADAALPGEIVTICARLLHECRSAMLDFRPDKITRLRADTRRDSKLLEPIRARLDLAVADKRNDQNAPAVAINEDFQIMVWIIHRMSKILSRRMGETAPSPTQTGQSDPQAANA